MSATAPVGVTHHLVALKVENRAGVLVRIAGLFSRRGYNIVSLAVAPTDDARFSRISVVVDVESAPLQQILDQLDKLINVVEIREIAPADALERELLMATVRTGARAEDVRAIVESAAGELLDEDAERATVALSADPEALDVFEAALGEFGIIELNAPVGSRFLSLTG